MRHLNKLFLALAICVALTPIGAYADKGGHGHGGGDHDRDDRGSHHDKDRDRDRHHHDDDDDRDGKGRPPGWDKGKKVGWGNCNEPPGQAKKHGGCGNSVRHDRDHDRDDRRNTGTTHTWHGSTTTSGTVTTQTTTTTPTQRRIPPATIRPRRTTTNATRIQSSKD